MAPNGTALAGVTSHSPLPANTRASSGARASSPLMAFACAVNGFGFDQLGNRVQRHHHRGLWPLANQKRTCDDHRHQGIDVELATPQSRQPHFVRC